MLLYEAPNCEKSTSNPIRPNNRQNYWLAERRTLNGNGDVNKLPSPFFIFVMRVPLPALPDTSNGSVSFLQAVQCGAERHGVNARRCDMA